MIEGWWVTFSFSGLSLTIGAVLWLVWRDRQRKRRRRLEAERRMLEEVLGSDHPALEQIERQFGKKG